MTMIETSRQYELAVAAERAAFEAMMALDAGSPEYPAMVERWKAAMAASDKARTRLMEVFGVSEANR